MKRNDPPITNRVPFNHVFARCHHSDLLIIRSVDSIVYFLCLIIIISLQFSKEVDDNYYNFEIQKKKKYYLAVLR